MEHIVIGCGLTGTVIARHLAEKGEKVVIWERRNHIGGNMYDYIDENGICVHKYGPHVFHTYQKELMEYMMRFGTWVDFPITCRVEMLGKVTPSPFNYQTIDDYYEKDKATQIKRELEKEFPSRDKVTILEMLNSSNSIVREYADFLFEHDYSLYTAKQWGIDPSKVDPSVLARVPVLLSYKDGYFDDTYQKVPIDGYTAWFKDMLNHKNIEVELSCNALDHIEIQNNNIYLDGQRYDGKLYYTGPIDELLHCKYGSLPYRSLKFEWKTEQCKRYQDGALVAHPEASGFTRITEYSHFPQKSLKGVTSLAYEYPLAYQEGKKNEPYYPVNNTKSVELYAKYFEELKSIDNLVLCGRLADYKYYNMDQCLKRALDKCRKL